MVTNIAVVDLVQTYCQISWIATSLKLILERSRHTHQSVSSFNISSWEQRCLIHCFCCLKSPGKATAVKEIAVSTVESSKLQFVRENSGITLLTIEDNQAKELCFTDSHFFYFIAWYTFVRDLRFQSST
ncbi:hypothetical protein CEXT_656961 [Caerostris extrusa]|uniref:Uncharacterized protein n=1 Tax=Caerostris extrusa TaxID=172846 RepID=A0AAV4T7V0_CAEEX|nr:hypothetical protein CEXT_656961 [Caerostris extrusa]